MLWKIEKSNAAGNRWAGRQWWVEAVSELEAIRKGKANWPSKNNEDQFHATPLTKEEHDAYYREQAEITLRQAERRIKAGVPVMTRQQERLAAYIGRCEQNLAASLGRLDSRGTVPEGVMSHLGKIAERILDK